MLGISPDAWRDAVETMGQADASIVVAAILQKGDEARFPGGYLRALTACRRRLTDPARHQQLAIAP
jgi:replication initiation protein RepC